MGNLPSRNAAMATISTAHAAKTTSRSSTPHCHTKSALLKNFQAIPNSKIPRTILRCSIQLPDRPWERRIKVGKRPMRMNGSAKTVENTNIPRIGRNHSPRAAANNNVPTNWIVQVKAVKVKATPIRKMPAKPPVFLEKESSRLINAGGRLKSRKPIKLTANSTKRTPTAKFNHGLEAS